jgi:hypothetical protein
LLHINSRWVLGIDFATKHDIVGVVDILVLEFKSVAIDVVVLRWK